MEYQPGILEAPTELWSTVARPGALETIPGLLLEQWWLSLKPCVTSWSKGYSKPWSPIPGSHGEPQLELEGYLKAIMLEAYLAGGYLCPKLISLCQRWSKGSSLK
jgi:hypothetical protein